MTVSSSMEKSNEVYEAIVVGLGGHGSAALAHLARSRHKDAKILGIEQFQRTHKLGSSHGLSRIYRQAYFEDPSCMSELFQI